MSFAWIWDWGNTQNMAGWILNIVITPVDGMVFFPLFFPSSNTPKQEDFRWFQYIQQKTIEKHEKDVIWNHFPSHFLLFGDFRWCNFPSHNSQKTDDGKWPPPGSHLSHWEFLMRPDRPDPKVGTHSTDVNKKQKETGGIGEYRRYF